MALFGEKYGDVVTDSQNIMILVLSFVGEHMLNATGEIGIICYNL